jgi:hypothetical protein
MRAFGWTVALIAGGYTAFVLLKSLPDIGRYIKLSQM